MGNRSILFGIAACTFAACSIDLSALQRTDAGINSATDPDDLPAGGMSGNGGAGAPNAAASGTSAANSGAGGAGEAGTAGSSGVVAGSRPVSGTTGGAGAGTGAGGQPVAGSSPPPPPAAGAPAGGSAGSDEPIPPKSCGFPGLPCCTPGNMCDVGACLRGKCTPYGGYYARTDACTSGPCTSRNGYTAGCSCPLGFTDTLIWHEAKACDTGASGVTEVRSCTAGRTPGVAFGGSWVQGPDGNCTISCLTPNPLTGMCTCPEGTAQISMTVDMPGATCPDAPTTLQICIDTDGKPINFGGAYAVSQSASFGCAAANPLTAACSCPDGATTPQSLHAGSWSIFVCNL